MGAINLGRVVGKDGKNASINGINTLTISAGDNINLVQTGDTLKIEAKNQTAKQVGAIPASEKGATNGVATLDADGRLNKAQLPDEWYIYDKTEGTKYAFGVEDGLLYYEEVV